MATIRKFCCNDLLRFTSVNLDHLTSTAEMSLYLHCLAKWSDYFLVAVAPGNRIMGYIIGSVEDDSEKYQGERYKKLLMALTVIGFTEEDFDEFVDEHWQGLAVAVHVAPEYRRRGLATRLVRLFEQLLVDKMLLSPGVSEYYTFVYVLIDNTPAKKLFEKCGYEVTRISQDFYMNDKDENIDSYEMRKLLSEEEGIKYSTVDQLESLRKSYTTTK